MNNLILIEIAKNPLIMHYFSLYSATFFCFALLVLILLPSLALQIDP